MKTIYLWIAFLCMFSNSHAQIVLREDISEAFSENSSYRISLAKLKITDPAFINYILSNWKWIAQNIENLPESKGDFATKEDAFNSSVITFSEVCQKLPPLEYLDFLDQMLGLYEQKRISYTTFKRVILPDLEKQDFSSVNYSHPRMSAVLKKAIALTPTEDESLRSCLEDMASGALADNYMTDRGDDAPLPETLPGVKLKRPWGSIIRKYERITGKKVPPDPDFPDEDETRPEKRRSGSFGNDEALDIGITDDVGILPPGGWIASGLACLAVAVAIGMFIRQKVRAKR